MVKKICMFGIGILLSIFQNCVAQKLEIKYYPRLQNFDGICTITCNDSTCTLQFNIFRRYVSRILWIDRKKESNEILLTDNVVISTEQINKVKVLYEKANYLASYQGIDHCYDYDIIFLENEIVRVTGTCYNNTSYNEDKFELAYPMSIQAYDFFKLSVEIMLETLNDKKSKKYVRCIENIFDEVFMNDM